MNARSHTGRLPQKFSAAEATRITGLPADAIAAARTICEEFDGGVRQGGGIPAVAERIGVKVQVLYNKLAGDEDAHHKLTLRDLLLIWLATGRIEHLQALARTMGCLCFPAPDLSKLSDQALLDLTCKVHEEGGHFHAVTRRALDDGRIDPVEAAQLRREAYEWMGAIAELLARLEGLADA